MDAVQVAVDRNVCHSAQEQVRKLFWRLANSDEVPRLVVAEGLKVQKYVEQL